LGFFHESRTLKAAIAGIMMFFQFPLLGIFPWICWKTMLRMLKKQCLSIPSTWDFSMNRWSLKGLSGVPALTFNSLYLGFFHESHIDDTLRACCAERLSIPSTWDFSMNPLFASGPAGFSRSLSIPSTWDFSMNLKKLTSNTTMTMRTFNSLYLGFFHESTQTDKNSTITAITFQFPLLGIFPWILPKLIKTVPLLP